MKIGICAYDCEVGISSLEFLLKEYPSHVVFLCTIKKDSRIASYVMENHRDIMVITYEEMKSENRIDLLKALHLDYIILAWWPYILPSNIIEIPLKGVLNLHPGYLPYNAGKHTNFWSIVEDVPFGVTMHFVDEGIDSGDIVFQKRIEKTWEDTGKTLYEKEICASIELFRESYPKLLIEDFVRKKQDMEKRRFHYEKDMFEKTEIHLDDIYKAKDLLNLLRAKEFQPHKGCTFEYEGRVYEIHISINQIGETN